MPLPIRRFPDAESGFAALSLQRIVGCERAATPSYIIVRLSFVNAG
jgi:hypothetical protein